MNMENKATEAEKGAFNNTKQSFEIALSEIAAIENDPRYQEEAKDLKIRLENLKNRMEADKN